ncbi:MAG: hypothetical protein MUF37_05350 [Methanoregulaceae archaeon]|jgi:hypothetical protein|nr:hypothetical protein [Methanoregulaceae archaeon]
MKFIQITICAAVLIFLVLCSGCTTSQEKVPVVPSPTVAEPTTVATIIPSATASPIPNNNLNTLNPTAIPTTFVGISSLDINHHFMDLAFGGGNVYLERLPASTVQNDYPTTISVSNGNSADIKVIEKFITEFNDLSASAKLSENIKEGVTGEIQIKFISPEGLKAVDMAGKSSGWLNKEFKNNGVTKVKVKDQTIYINSDLQGTERQHYLLLGLLFELGFKGSSLKYPDSIFFEEGTDTTSLSKLDSKAVQIMYGLGMFNGMTVDDVKKKVFIST